MDRAFENQKRIEVSLTHVCNGSLVLKAVEKSLSKTATFLTSAIETSTPLTSMRIDAKRGTMSLDGSP